MTVWHICGEAFKDWLPEVPEVAPEEAGPDGGPREGGQETEGTEVLDPGGEPPRGQGAPSTAAAGSTPADPSCVSPR